MELHQLTAEEIRGFDSAKINETEGDIRRALVTIRMDIYTAKNQHTSKIRGLKKSLARVMTVRTEVLKKAGVAKKTIKAPKAAVEAKPKAAKAPKAEAKAKAEKPAKTEAKAKTSTKKK